MTNWQRVCALSDVQEDAPLGITLDEKSLGIFRVGEEVFVIDDVCSHEYALLSTGYQEGDTIECPLHQAIFNLRTGQHLSPPARCGVRSYKVRIEDENIFVDLSSPG